MLKDIKVNNTNVKYWFKDNKARETTLFIHGLCGDHRGLVDCSNYLNNQNILILDLPGYGLSEPLSGSHDLEGYADFILNFLDKLNIKKINLVGHSFGASVALKFFDKFPERIVKLFLISPVVSESNNLSFKIGKLFFKFAGLFNDNIFHFLICNKLIVYITDAFVIKTKDKIIKRQILSEDYENYKRAYAKTIRDSFYAIDLEGFNFTNPKLINIEVLIGKYDSLSSANNVKLISQIPKLKVLIKSGGHLINQENPKLVGNIISEFLV